MEGVGKIWKLYGKYAGKYENPMENMKNMENVEI